MLVGIDGRLLGKRRGLGNYIYHLLLEYPRIDHDHRFVIYVSTDEATLGLPRDQRFRVANLGPWPYPIWEQVILPIALARDRIRLLHSPANTSPLFLPKGIKRIVTIADTMFLLPLPRSPSVYQRLGRKYYAWSVRNAAPKADAVLTISQYSAVDIARHVGIPASKLHVTYLAAAIRSQSEIMDQDKIEVDEPFVLALGAVDPRKNTEMVLRVFARVMQDYSLTHKLVLVGIPDGSRVDFQEQVLRAGLQGRVNVFGYVSDALLARLYERAAAFLYPSLYEGFGIPILEAMMAGCPTISSNSTSIPEVAGDAALLVDPRNELKLADALVKVLTDTRFADELRAKGRRNACRFSWRRTAEQTLAVYEKVLAA